MTGIRQPHNGASGYVGTVFFGTIAGSSLGSFQEKWMTHEILRMTATQLLVAYRDRSLSPIDVARAMLNQIERVNPQVNAYCLVDCDTTLQYAQQSEQRYVQGRPQGLLDGVPVAIKDVFLTPMWPTLKGSHTVDPATTLNKHAPAIAALQRHGYVPLGKTTTPEFGWKGVTDSPLCGPTNNPFDPRQTAGGSSGGSGAAVALGMGPLALGTDAGGSIRIPAGFCGVVGLKPTYGEVPHWPPPPFGTLAHAGPMTWTVEDCALLMNVLTEADARDAQAVPRRGIDYVAELRDCNSDRIKGVKIAYSRTLGYVQVDAQVAQAVDVAVKVLQDQGANVTEVDPGFSDPLDYFGRLFFGGAANAVRDLSPEQLALLDPQLRAVAEEASKLSMLDYLDAANQRAALCERMSLFHQEYDLLVTPTLPITAFTTNREVPVGWPQVRWPTWTPFTYPFNLTGQPALSVPCGFSDAGLPIGLQIVGARFDDAQVLRVGHAYQRAVSWTDRRPSLFDRP